MEISKKLLPKMRTWAVINIDNAEYNFKCIKSKTDSCICCVIKANAYGHGAVQLAKLYQTLGADYLAVSTIEEALQLRKNHIFIPILILGYTSCNYAKILADNNITQCVFSYEYGKDLSKAAKLKNVVVKVHIKIDTGMGRIGFLCRDHSSEEIEKAIKVCHFPGINAEGIFTHFAVADESTIGQKYTQEQFEYFMKAVEMFESRGIRFKFQHCANSATIFDYPQFHLDMVRAGIILYGLRPSEQVKNMPELKPVMSIHSRIAHIKTIEKGQSISYGRTYVAPSTQKIATIPIGYADGFRRMTDAQTYSLCIHGKPAQIVGRVCMDQLMADVTALDCNIGDEVIVFGDNYPFTVNELAKANNTINYEIICDIGKRVPRVFVKDNKIIEWEDDILGESFALE